MSVKIDFKPSNNGSPVCTKYRSIINKDGSVTLVPNGVRYLQDEIDSYEEMCNVNNIVKRFLSGDTNAINGTPGIYTDIMSYPGDRQAALQSIVDAQNAFESLPVDIRNKFGNSWEAFYIASGTPEFAKMINLENPDTKENKE